MGQRVLKGLRNRKVAPVSIKLDGGQLVITKLVNAAIDDETGYIVGWERIEIARINVCD